ncbi:sigma-54-dependent Fis family transcriptional regulator [Candidatus Nomurabacteria bacterium]|nr:sigma-54-dependent Fis family transcriptional regulator [Candidatus Nomurabacteria bacterium]
MAQLEQRQTPIAVPKIIGVSQHAENMRRFAVRAAETEDTLFLYGETGTGKNVLAQFVHHLDRPTRPLVFFTCGVMPSSLIESELFGHKAGAFTDAKHDKVGLLQHAGDGTIFINEVESMQLESQAKLLDVLDRRVFRRTGDVRETEFRARFIFATNQDPERAVREGRLRADLYYRINAINFTVSPLRARPEDIMPLSENFLARRGVAVTLSTKAILAMKAYAWPGNVRELENALRRGLFNASGEEITPEDLGIVGFVELSPTAPASDRVPTLEENERAYLEMLLQQTKFNITLAAQIARVARQHFHKMIRKHKLPSAREARAKLKGS